MKRKPTFTTSLGSISSGTMRPEDLIPDFADALSDLLATCRVDRATRKAHVALVKWADAGHNLSVEPYYSQADHVLDELFDALGHYAPPYAYFGAHPGDGADYGFWPCEEDELPRLEAGDDHREFWGGDGVILVNDHGNATCGRYDKRGRFHEYWSCV